MKPGPAGILAGGAVSGMLAGGAVSGVVAGGAVSGIVARGAVSGIVPAVPFLRADKAFRRGPWQPMDLSHSVTARPPPAADRGLLPARPCCSKTTSAKVHWRVPVPMIAHP